MYLRSFLQAVHPTLPRFDSWFFMLPPLNLGLQLSSSPAALQLEPLQEKQFVQTSTISWTFRHAVPPPSFPAESLSFNGKPVSKCVPLSRPTRVLSVIPFTGAPFLHGKATTTTPGQKTVLTNPSDSELLISDFGILFMASNHVRVYVFVMLLPRLSH